MTLPRQGLVNGATAAFNGCLCCCETGFDICRYRTTAKLLANKGNVKKSDTTL